VPVTEHPTAEESRARRRRLFLLLGPIALATAAAGLGTALAPKLLDEHPLLLLALNPVPRHMVLASGKLGILPFVSVAVARHFFADPFYFMIGRFYGKDAVRWVERRSGGASRVLHYAERAFDKARYLVLFVWPEGLVCVLAGASGMRVSCFIAVDVAGTLTLVLLARLFGAALSEPLEAAREFIAANVVVLTIISALVALASVVLQRRRARAAARQQARDADFSPNDPPPAA
jgi:membrane protein DedA with SNARE-associated domain